MTKRPETRPKQNMQKIGDFETSGSNCVWPACYGDLHCLLFYVEMCVFKSPEEPKCCKYQSNLAASFQKVKHRKRTNHQSSMGMSS